MFDFVHKHKILIQIVLAVVFLPFAFFGVDSYFRSSDFGVDIGSVNGRSITQQEYAQALQERQAALQRMIGGMAVSLLTTIAGLVGGILLRILYNQAEALMTDIGFTGGGKGAGMVYLAGSPHHKQDNEGMIEHIVGLVEARAAELEGAKAAAE